MTNKKYLGQKNKITGNTLLLRDNLENGEEVFICGKCGKEFERFMKND